MANQLKRDRRLKLGDKDTSARIVSNDSTSGIPAQPIPGMPQGKGNVMNNPDIPKSFGGGAAIPGAFDANSNRSMYGDPVFSKEQLANTGAVGFFGNSGQPENLVPGRGLNQQAYNTVPQPKEGMSMAMLLPQELAKEAATRAEKLYGAGSSDKTASYQIGPMGMLGTPVETSIQGGVNPGQLPAQTPGQTNTIMPLTGNVTASVQQSGMNTGRGGGRNQKPQNA